MNGDDNEMNVCQKHGKWVVVIYRNYTCPLCDALKDIKKIEKQQEAK